MGGAPITRPSLLVRIRDTADHQAWSQFVELYAPVIYGFARKHGLQDADAADLTQDVLRVVAKTIQGLDYDRQRGSFRGWLFTVLRNKLRNFVTRRRPYEQGTGDTDAQMLLQEQPAPEEDAAASWDRDFERQLFACAAKQVRGRVQPATWQAFWLTTVQGKSGKQVAEELKMTVAAVYVAKSRVMAQLKEQVRLLREESGDL
jgi:RNA polymerase sigma factor (sigma-70 family)